MSGSGLRLIKGVHHFVFGQRSHATGVDHRRLICVLEGVFVETTQRLDVVLLPGRLFTLALLVLDALAVR